MHKNETTQIVECPLYFLKFESDYFYTVHPGKHHFVNNSHHNHHNGIGPCYYCGSSNHYQSYCPLKKCAQCGQYGHDATTHSHYSSSSLSLSHHHRKPCFPTTMKKKES